MEQKSCLKFIYKIPSRMLRKANWNLDMPLKKAMSEYPEIIVSLNDSQLLRFIDEFNGIEDVFEKVKSIQREIKFEKKKPKSKETKIAISSLYDKLYSLQFQRDYVCVIMNSNRDYDKANEGFKINGIEYRRFLGTNGGIKNSTIVYVNAALYPELKRRLDNGRDMSKELVPAKLEAYQALICSGSTPLPEPKGFIVVPDCVLHFKEDVIKISDGPGEEPVLTYEQDYEVERDNSDGCGMMLPSYSSKVNQYLNGVDMPLSGMNTRYSFEKGMVYTFDFVEFAEKVAGTYEVTDVWGVKRDVREAEVILTESMLKLWDSYDSWEDYKANCDKNHYRFSTPKIAPDKLENVRTTNYQFLQSYDLSEKEIQNLCQSTVDTFHDVLGMDYRKSILFMAGTRLEDNSFDLMDDCSIKALMVEPNMITDSFIRNRIYKNIAKKIDDAKKGTLQIKGNYSMISGDLYALAQSMFGLEVTGLLKAGEIYNKYWIDNGDNQVVCFRAPMTCMNNIRSVNLCKSEDALHWFQYITTATIINAHDTMADALDGCDFDGDTTMITNDPVLLANTLNSPTIMCMQRKAAKTVPTELDIINSNKDTFGSQIGQITNRVTSMFEIRAGYQPESKEYEELSYRIMCGQYHQQGEIDAAKGAIVKPMPEYWYRITGENRKGLSQMYLNIVADKKPYFMQYIYPELKTRCNNYQKDSDFGANMKFAQYGIHSIDDLRHFKNKTKEMRDYLNYYDRYIPVGMNPCTINRICWLFEDAFNQYLGNQADKNEFDYSILKSEAEYSQSDYDAILSLYNDYKKKLEAFKYRMKSERIDSYDSAKERKILVDLFKRSCEEVCTNEDELCNIVLDICYQKESSKQFAWDVSGDTMIKNLLRRNGNKISFPRFVSQGGDFFYGGEGFVMTEKVIDDDCIE